MYSPKRKESYSSILKTPDRSSLLNTPSNPFTPLVNVIKSAQSKANEDFDRFYGSLWATITPRNTDYHSIKKRVPEVTQRAQSMINQKHVDMETKSRTSLTPLIERHTLREDVRRRYQYRSRNPFSQEASYDGISTPELEESQSEEDVPVHNRIKALDTLDKRINCQSHTMDTPDQRINQQSNTKNTLDKGTNNHSHTVDTLDKRVNHQPNVENSLYMGTNYQSNTYETPVALRASQHSNTIDTINRKIKTQLDTMNTSDGRMNHPSPVRRNEYSAKSLPSPTRNTHNSSLLSRLYDERKRMDDLQTNISTIRRQSSFLAENPAYSLTDPESDSENEEEDMMITQEYATPFNHVNNNHPTSQSNIIHSHFPTPSAPPPPVHFASKTAEPPYVMNKATPTVTRQLETPPPSVEYRKANKSPRRINLQDEIPFAKLRSTETIQSPGGTVTKNKFWKEIHGLNARQESVSIRTGRIEKPTPSSRRISQLNHNLQSSSKKWDTDNRFWSDDSDSKKITSSFNHRLFRMAQKERDEARYSHSLGDELESARKREEQAKKPSIPKFNANIVAELKAKHQGRYLDDSDSYKFS